MKKRVLVLLSVLLILCVIVPNVSVFAYVGDSIKDSGRFYSSELVISDPETGESWKWELPQNVINNRQVYNVDKDNTEKVTELTVNVGEYILQTITPPRNTERVLYDNLTLTVGLRYSVNTSNNTIAVYRAYGSAPNKGLYYSKNKSFYYDNPGVFNPITQHPTSQSWSYSTDSRFGYYFSDFPPYALLDCRIVVTGMESSYRDVSVRCQLDWF